MKHTKTKLLVVSSICCLLVSPTLSLALCSDLDGLYQNRKELRNRYDQDVSSNYLRNKEKAELYKTQIQVIDEKYGDVVRGMFLELEKKQYMLFQRCCDSQTADRHLLFICKLATYYRDRNVERFLSNIEVSRETIPDFWSIDEIMSSDVNRNKPLPKVFTQKSFVFAFLDEIYRLAAGGNGKAIDLYLRMNSFADGIYAEFMAENILDLIENHPKVVMKNWKVMGRYKTTIHLWSAGFQFKAGPIIEKYEDLCKTPGADSLSCREISQFLRMKERGE